MKEHNIIGSGGYGTVYRVVVDGLGYVAVKMIWENKKLDNNLEKSFHTEVKILSSIRHRNIVKLLCCIANNDKMLLVYMSKTGVLIDGCARKIILSLQLCCQVRFIVLFLIGQRECIKLLVLLKV